jgi:hypothetical protein
MACGASPTPTLTARDTADVERARQLLAQLGGKNYGGDPVRLASDLGALEWAVGSLIAVIDRLTGRPASPSTPPRA